MSDFIATLCERIKAAQQSATPLAIHGTQSKHFYGEPAVGDALDMQSHAGVVAYEPKELVLTVRAGSTLAELHALTAAENQMLAFEPPAFGAVGTRAGGGTIGGAVATGLSGPRRPYAGAVRDFILGTRIINGKGEDLRFGGRVIKNVAGYDVSRLMAGAMGTLGVITEVSLKVMPRPVLEVTRVFDMDEATAIRHFNEWAGKPNPLSATAWIDGRAHVRLSGTEAGVKAAVQRLGGEAVSPQEADAFWHSLRDQTQAFFVGTADENKPLWRISVPSTCAPIDLAGAQIIEWGGALRWWRGEADVQALRSKVAALGGHVTLMRAGSVTAPRFHPLSGKMAEIHRNLKAAFDPADILNRGRMGQF